MENVNTVDSFCIGKISDAHMDYNSFIINGMYAGNRCVAVLK